MGHTLLGQALHAVYGTNVSPDATMTLRFSDGRVQGYAYNGTDYDFALTRYNPEGSLDTSGFGTSGKVMTNFGFGSDRAFAAALQTDGKIVVAGHAWNGTNNDLALARYNSDGSLDTATFGNGSGKVMLDFSGFDDSAKAVAIQPLDDKIVVAGYTWNGSNDEFALARFEGGGNPDTAGFGNGTGKVTTDFAGASDRAHALVLQTDGRIVVAGSADNGTPGNMSDFALARYLSDGSLDSGFGTGGKITADFDSSIDIAEAVAIYPAAAGNSA